MAYILSMIRVIANRGRAEKSTGRPAPGIVHRARSALVAQIGGGASRRATNPNIYPRELSLERAIRRWRHTRSGAPLAHRPPPRAAAAVPPGAVRTGRRHRNRTSVEGGEMAAHPPAADPGVAAGRSVASEGRPIG